jgi:uncharacterized C2H2 Zn-finger protein
VSATVRCPLCGSDDRKMEAYDPRKDVEGPVGEKERANPTAFQCGECSTVFKGEKVLG